MTMSEPCQLLTVCNILSIRTKKAWKSWRWEYCLINADYLQSILQN